MSLHSAEEVDGAAGVAATPPVSRRAGLDPGDDAIQFVGRHWPGWPPVCWICTSVLCVWIVGHNHWTVLAALQGVSIGLERQAAQLRLDVARGALAIEDLIDASPSNRPPWWAYWETAWPRCWHSLARPL